MCDEKWNENIRKRHEINQKMLDKYVFGISIIAIPLLVYFNGNLKNSFLEFIFYSVSISLFFLIVMLHIIACRSVIEASDLLLSKDLKDKKEGIETELFAHKIDKIRDYIFIISLNFCFFSYLIFGAFK